MLATAVGDHPSDWEIHISKLCFAYNTSVHSTTGYSQFFPMFGRQATIPVDLMHNLNQGQEKELPSYAHQLREGLKEAYALVRNHCELEHQLQKAIYDRKVHGKPFSIGNMVWLFSPAVPSGRCKKFHHPWKGPFIVVEKKGSSTYKIKDRNGGKFQIVHFDRLKPCMKTSALNDELPAPPKSNISSSLSQQPQVMARPDTPHGGEDLLLSDDKDGGQDHDAHPPDVGPAAEVPVPLEQHPVPLGIPDALCRYPTRERHPLDHYSPFIEH